MTVIIILLLLYFLPAVVASVREHPQAVSIWLLDIFLGWTLVGWVVALVWSASAKPTPLVVQTAAPTAAPSGDAEEIERFAKLRDAGRITDAEFQAKKAQILGLPGSSAPAEYLG